MCEVLLYQGPPSQMTDVWRSGVLGAVFLSERNAGCAADSPSMVARHCACQLSSLRLSSHDRPHEHLMHGFTGRISLPLKAVSSSTATPITATFKMSSTHPEMLVW